MAKPHVLVVDDDFFVVDTLTTYLERQGCRVTSASGCEEARLRLREDDKVDLMILDYMMPDGTGADLLQSLKDLSFQGPPVILSSGILDPKDPAWDALRKRLSPRSQGLIQAYVTKPYSLDAMEVAVREVLGGDYLPKP